MASKKRDLEIIYNLVWKNRLSGDDRSIIVGVYDIPSTTLNWEKFKSYVLKNSGTSTEHVKVYYIDCNERELPIESQEDFQLALYSFRKRARDGDINMLKLEKVANPKIPAVKRKVAKPREELVDKHKMDIPPEWFTRYMRKFKKEMMEEMTTTMMKINTPRKSRSETRKVALELSSKDLKHLKSEKKLEKSDYNKTFKMKTLKQAMKDAFEGVSKVMPPPINEIECMNASLVTNAEFPIVHLMGGETYMHSWDVINCGMLPWNKNTVIQFSWGSQDLVPIERIIECPHLKPGEIGAISTYYSVPEIPGLYECYWHFHHNGNRFGKWLGLQVIVDDIKKRKHDVKVERAVEIESNTKTEDIALERMLSLHLNENDDSGMVEPEEHSEVDKPENADADSISIISLNGSNSSKDGYVMIYGNENAEAENAQASLKEEKPEQQEAATHNNEEINVAEDIVTDYAFIYYNGEKYPLHKKYLKEDYFHQAEAEPPTACIKQENPIFGIPEELNNEGGLSNDSMIQSMLSSCENRLFIFPQQSPGFEVVQSVSTPQVPELEETELTTNSVNATALQEDPQNTEFHSADEYEDQNKNITGAANRSFNMSASDSAANRSCNHHPQDSPRCCFKDRSMSENHQNMSHNEDYECEYSSYSSRSSTARSQNIAPENLLTGAALLASSAMSTARSMMDMVMQSGKWVNGHWVSESPNGKRESALAALSEMGFNDRDLNATLLARYNDDVCKVVSELIQ